MFLPFKKSILLFLFLSIVSTLFAVHHPYQTVDDLNYTNFFKSPPQRIVSVLPSLTETVWALGFGSKLIGVDRYSIWPTNLSTLPQVGGGLDPNLELIVSLKPDLVLMARSSRGAERLRVLGVKVVQLETQTYQDIPRVMNQVALNLGESTTLGDKLWKRVEDSVKLAMNSIPKNVVGQTYYFEVSPGPYGAGESSFIGELLNKLGLKNIIPSSMGPFPKLSPEYIVTANPDLIFISERSSKGLASRPGWQSMNAIKKNQIYEISASDIDMIVRPGPRLGEAALALSKMLSQKKK